MEECRSAMGLSDRDEGQNATLKRLLAMDPADAGCAEASSVVELYVEAEVGKDPEARFPGVAAHYRACPACRADHDGLLAAVEPAEQPHP